MCSYTDRRNRNLENLVYKECGHAEHADLNASKNIRDLYIDQSLKGQADVNQPNVSGLRPDASSGASPLSN